MSGVEPDKLRKKINDCKQTGKLNLSYMDLPELSPSLVQQIKNQVPQIAELDLRSNVLTSLPDDLAELKSIKAVRLNYNKFTTFPSVLALLPRLVTLEMPGNQMTSLDDSIGKMPVIKDLDFSGNQLASLNPKIAALNTLTTLNLENNQLTSLPEEIGHMRNISKLDLSTNQLYNLPNSLGKLQTLQKIDVSANKLSMVPPSMGHLKGLRDFDIRYNDLKEPAKSRYEEGIPKFLEFLREEEERLKQEEIERMKPVGMECGNWLEYRLKVNQADPKVDSKCYLRTGHSTTVGGSKIYVFGGSLMTTGQKTNDLFMLNQDRMEWVRLEVTGAIPPPRDGHCAAYDEQRKQLVVFGGRSADKKRLNDLHVLDVKTLAWRRPNMDGNIPLPREQASFTPVTSSTLCLFGGHGSGQRFNDLHYLDMETYTWMQPNIGGSGPSPRQGAAVAVAGDCIYIHGGRNNFVCDDLWVVSMGTLLWSEVKTTGRQPAPRHNHIITVTKNCLFVYGGTDELGGSSNALFKLTQLDLVKPGELPPLGPNGLPVRPGWTEIEHELKPNVCRVPIFDRNNVFGAMQVGSPNLGMIAKDDISEEVFWDVYKTCSLFDLAEKELDEASLRPVNAKKMRIKHATENVRVTPTAGFRTVSPKEQLMLDYVEKFRLQFVELYPTRRPLLLFPPNECAVNKFVCTTVRPSQLPFTDLYDHPSCIRFVADFLKYEVLENPIEYPENLPSPYSVLTWQAGDCFDFSSVLVSLLTGVGYDAYCVMGYAPKAVTFSDQELLTCPILEREAALRLAEANRPKPKPEVATKYRVKEALALESNFDREMYDKEMARIMEEQRQMEQDRIAAEEEEARAEVQSDPDEFLGRRVHCWVLVMAGQREIPENFFVEPSTGRCYPCGESPYEGVEFIWNHTNFWVNMQESTVKMDPSKPGKIGLPDISWDLKNTDKWEYVLETQDPLESLNRVEEEVPAAAPVALATADENAEGVAPMAPVPAAAGPERPTERRNSRAFRGQSSTKLQVMDAPSVHDEQEEAEERAPEQTLDMPPSWVPKLKIPREIFDMRCPKGEKLTEYCKCTYEVYAMFGECARWDGKVSKLTIFLDLERTKVQEVREVFARRKDRLRERHIFHLDDKTQEYFDPGSSFGLKEITTVKKKERLMHFYKSARLDGLVTRKEEFGLKLTEHFEERDDRLVYRSATYDPLPPRPPSPPGAAGAKRVGRKKKSDEPQQPMRKMTEKFSLDPAVDSEQCVRKRTYFVVGDQIRLDYHYGKNRITANSRIYSKDGVSQITQINPLEEKPKDQVLLEEWQSLVLAEKECTQNIRDVEKECKSIVHQRNKDEQNIAQITPYYDVVRVKHDESDEEGTGEDDKVEHDYLSPFLPATVGGRQLTKDDALKVRENCLKALKDRLIERANIIQARHDEETAALAKRQTNFQRDRDNMGRPEEEEYEQACEESMFRIHILEQRLKRHEEQALQKYYDLDAKLRSDPRLNMLMSAG
mmetsp:Transcript_46212/g.88190  ORF Transcript_46212/g.88190 Transcript_46212/m.88190 type:complete len:1493 (-) Transcript_46212:386-4864(-)|eukprot:CAMPEP_0114274656 /NCGR_PEP_ID=MMETSP0058-20121206/29893_1 /TAXON_ID=36894 /ORGANISM="Pyramimonas parkeae, CCMP726" /LENGTH=1492 /DNA_ID=CAMNT_0001394485 /DNA_START=146 /DNA_END=4624 /DNA_ORIENTATION=-